MTEIDYTENTIYAKFEAIDNPVQLNYETKCSVYASQVLCIPISVNITWNSCLVWPGLRGNDGNWL